MSPRWASVDNTTLPQKQRDCSAVATWTTTALWCITNESRVHRKAEREGRREGGRQDAGAVCLRVSKRDKQKPFSSPPDDIEATMKQLAPNLPLSSTSPLGAGKL